MEAKNEHLVEEDLRKHIMYIQHILLAYTDSHGINNCCTASILETLLVGLAISMSVPLHLLLESITEEYKHLSTVHKQMKEDQQRIHDSPIKFHEA